MLRHAEHVMGTVFSFAVRDADDRTPAALDAAVARLHELDRRFSPFRPDSDVSRVNAGELTPDQARGELAQVLARCRETAAQTDGFFTERPDGRALDPSGWVKGWAVAEASRILAEAGSADHCVGGGGDLQTLGGPWRIGIADPEDAGRLKAVVEGSGLAVATSGTGERGAHITDPHTGRPVHGGWLSLTLVSETAGIARTDAWATAVFAMGPERGFRWAHRRPEVEALAVLPDGSLRCTPGFPRYLADTATADPGTYHAPAPAGGTGA
jgi:thiamine biosynthesis lipoprotein